MLPLKSTKEKKEIFRWRSFILWILLAIIIRWQIIEPRWIPSGSMLPTLQLKDRILIEKISPRLTMKFNKQLHYETIVVFSPPEQLVQAGYDPKAALIKRLVGLPGDIIEIKAGNLFRNGSLVKEAWLEKSINYQMEPIKVPKNEFWVLGDNRNNSLDSHVWGSLPAKNLIGTAVWRYWPIGSFGPIRFPTHEEIGDKDLTKVRFNTLSEANWDV